MSNFHERGGYPSPEMEALSPEAMAPSHNREVQIEDKLKKGIYGFEYEGVNSAAPGATHAEVEIFFDQQGYPLKRERWFKFENGRKITVWEEKEGTGSTMKKEEAKTRLKLRERELYKELERWHPIFEQLRAQIDDLEVTLEAVRKAQGLIPE